MFLLLGVSTIVEGIFPKYLIESTGCFNLHFSNLHANSQVQGLIIEISLLKRNVYSRVSYPQCFRETLWIRYFSLDFRFFQCYFRFLPCLWFCKLSVPVRLHFSQSWSLLKKQVVCSCSVFAKYAVGAFGV